MKCYDLGRHYESWADSIDLDRPCVTLVALVKRWVPRPTFTVEADMRLLTSRSVEATWTGTSAHVHNANTSLVVHRDSATGVAAIADTFCDHPRSLNIATFACSAEMCRTEPSRILGRTVRRSNACRAAANKYNRYDNKPSLTISSKNEEKMYILSKYEIFWTGTSAHVHNDACDALG